jgi:hypothetical protein
LLLPILGQQAPRVKADILASLQRDSGAALRRDTVNRQPDVEAEHDSF